MSERGPDFDDLVGPEVESPERDRLQRVHELLAAAGPPPELSSRVSAAPSAGRARLEPGRRRRAILALAATLTIVVFGAGYLVGNGRERVTVTSASVIAMTGTAKAPEAMASLLVYDADPAGNWPMELRVEGLAPSPNERRFQLWLTKDGELAALCGSFLAETDGSTVVPMNAPYRLTEFDGWVVVEQGSDTPVLTT